MECKTDKTNDGNAATIYSVVQQQLVDFLLSLVRCSVMHPIPRNKHSRSYHARGVIPGKVGGQVTRCDMR